MEPKNNEVNPFEFQESTTIWSEDSLKQYILYVRSYIQPVFSSEAAVLLQKFYQSQRRNNTNFDSRSTVRQL